ncbi:MAG: phosphoadenosine phosphosulfate reductase [Planktotalea sp.]|uniref:phosphoadenosine phosphosulfate reductase n=1 Tax=Planktotalea sp. TaxID=2029877 RepID=UPI0026390101|nr:phosphoadenosine phosphosulfate reductase [Planktotalea sp.]MDG1075585.1 phosphoadenosine phosphosulfate reductase [Planktotalea sp.]
MPETHQMLNESLPSQTGQAWLGALEELADEVGYFQPLSAKHNAAFIDAGKTLLVTFETVQSVQSMKNKSHPIGFEMVREHDWSLLSLFSDGKTWFRDPSVFRYFDRLVDDGFFEDFDRVIFYGAGSCGYAACAFSVAAPGAHVLALSPQASLDPRVSEWDDRFRRMRRVSFSDRYGYAPDMLDAAARATVIYDPRIELDAMHTALFTRANVDKLRMPYFGVALDVQMMRLEILYPLLVAVGSETSVPAEFYRLHRLRRRDRTYLRALLGDLEDVKRWGFAKAVCDHATTKLLAPRFKKRSEKIAAFIADQTPQTP